MRYRGASAAALTLIRWSCLPTGDYNNKKHDNYVFGDNLFCLSVVQAKQALDYLFYFQKNASGRVESKLAQQHRDSNNSGGYSILRQRFIACRAAFAMAS